MSTSASGSPPWSSSPASALDEAEALVAAGRSGELLERHGPIDPDRVPPTLAFVLGVAAKERELFTPAAQLLLRALADPASRDRAAAHLAHLDYYRGDFVEGLRRAAMVSASSPLARAESQLYRSVNLIALNDGLGALEAGLGACNLSVRVDPPYVRHDLRFRIARQLVHVHVAVGRYIEAAREAEVAAGLARRTRSDRQIAVAAYLRGFVRAARGDRTAIAYLTEAEARAGGEVLSFARWVRYVRATLLRDLGSVDEARRLRDRSRISIAWEDPLFELAETRHAPPPPLRDCPADEVPYRMAAAGLISLVASDGRGAADLLSEAQERFARGGLEHFRRGAALALAVARERAGERSEADRLVRAEIDDLQRFGLTRWPWWHPAVGRVVGTICARLGAAASICTALATAAVQASVPPPEALRSVGLTDREAEVVVTWTSNPRWSRKQLALALGVSEASIRNHLNRARRALNCDARRGPDALLERLDELRYRPERLPV